MSDPTESRIDSGECGSGAAGSQQSQQSQPRTNRNQTDSASQSATPSAESRLTCNSLFPFDEPYDVQADAMENIEETLQDRGFAAWEGPCGTGKTLGALVPAIRLIRHPDSPFKRVLVLTSARQQLRAFENDIEAINENLSDDIAPVDALTLVGKQHLCPYVQADSQQITEDRFYGQCNSVCNPIRDTISEQDSIHQAKPILRDLQGRAQASSSEGSLTGTSESGEWMAPYQTGIPSNQDEEYCPFYAGYREEFSGDDGYEPSGVNQPWSLLEEGVERGVCPHAMMMRGVDNSEVVLGNYKHAFDPLTVSTITSGIIDDETLVILDEAHGLIENAREELSDDLDVSMLKSASREIQRNIIDGDSNANAVARREVNKMVGLDSVKEAATFLSELAEHLDSRAVDALDAEQSNWHRTAHPDLPEDIIENFREPETTEQDSLTEWILSNDWRDMLGEIEQITTAVEEAYETAEDEVSAYRAPESDLPSVGYFLSRWNECDHSAYFRQLALSKRNREATSYDGYREHYTASVQIRNCIPREEIADRLDDFGAGILMSATLSPLDVYVETSGLADLDDRGRRVDTYVYGLRYPEANRESLAVDLPAYTRSNRGGHPAYCDSDEQEVRDRYYNTAKDVVTTTDGNVLVCLPSYFESTWIAERLQNDPKITKPILSDGPDVDSERIKRRFISGGPKVLTTGLRGTLTEGVDYDGDALKACVVIGVPIRSLGGDYPDAIQHAYAESFGSDDAFDYAFTVPAVQKARQGLGRVIRGVDEVGVRVIADKRYAQDWGWNDVRDYLPEYEQSDYDPINPADLKDRLETFWNQHPTA